MAIPEVGPILGVARLLASLFGKKPVHPHKNLEARLIARGVIAELPKELPFSIVDSSGEQYPGIYAIGLLIWNRGNQAISGSDFVEKAPLQVKIGENAKIAGVRMLPENEEADCQASRIDDQTLKVEFDLINPKEYVFVPIFITGNPHVEVKVTGRFVGQEEPIDKMALEVKASLGERASALLVLAMIVNAVPGFFGGAWLIHQQYGLPTIVSDPDSIPKYLMIPFILGGFVLGVYFYSRVLYWFQRRSYPEGFPLTADLEPPLRESIKGLWRTLFQGRKQRVSLSIFNWGKPVVLPARKLRRRTVEDWVQ